MPMDAETLLAAIETALVANSLPASIAQGVLQSIDSAGLDLVEAETPETPLATLGTLAATREIVEGIPGMYVVKVTLATGVTAVWVEHANKEGGISRFVPAIVQ